MKPVLFLLQVKICFSEGEGAFLFVVTQVTVTFESKGDKNANRLFQQRKVNFIYSEDFHVGT